MCRGLVAFGSRDVEPWLWTTRRPHLATWYRVAKRTGAVEPGLVRGCCEQEQGQARLAGSVTTAMIRSTTARISSLAELRYGRGSGVLVPASPPRTASLNAMLSCGIATSVDPNDDPSGHWRSGIAEVLAHVDVFFCNEAEALGLAASDDLDHAYAWFAHRLTPGAELVVKHGAEGAEALIVGTTGFESSVQIKPEQISSPLVDTVGAGDSLAAGYLAARMRGLSIEERLRIGVRNGTASTRGTGGVAAQLTWHEVSAG
jgi:sugar/nucleoside kinase (ribokinase family)